jgi:hypothetical protein
VVGIVAIGLLATVDSLVDDIAIAAAGATIALAMGAAIVVMGMAEVDMGCLVSAKHTP